MENLIEKYLEFGITLSLVIVNFIAYYSVIQSARIGNYFLKKYGNNKGPVTIIHFQRILGIVLFGIIPLSLTILLLHKNVSDYGLSFAISIDTLYWTLGISVLLVLLNSHFAKKSQNLKKYPQIQVKRWTKKLLFLSAIGWTGYIFSYELLFRGILLSETIVVFGIAPAIAINIILYALVHIPKGLKETILSIPFGVILCIVTINTGTIWVAVFTHVALALSNEWFSFYYNTEMTIIKSK